MRLRAGVMVLLGLLLASCSVTTTTPSEDQVTQPTRASSSTTAPSTSTTTTTVALDPVGRAGLYQVDPRTLELVDASAPITTADWLSGTSSKNGEWLALTVWYDGGPDTDLIRIVNVADQTVVSEANVLAPTHPMVADDGTAYWPDGDLGPFLRLHSLKAGERSAELAFAATVGFEALTDGNILDNRRIGWLGWFGPQTEENAPGLVVLDLSTSTTTTHLLPGVMVGGREVDLGETSIFEWFQPEVTWDAERSLAYVVHADQDAFTVVDLETGESDTHSWVPSTSWWGRLFTWLIPPAQAKGGPSMGTRRSLALSHDGATLFVGTYTGELDYEGGDDVTVLWSPRGVIALSTETGEVVQNWDIPASDVYLSPTGEYLVATGLTIHEKQSTSTEINEGAFIINVATGELVGHLMTEEGYWGYSISVQFSRSGNLAYLSSFGGPIAVAELESGEVISSITGPEYLTVFGESGLLATSRR